MDTFRPFSLFGTDASVSGCVVSMSTQETEGIPHPPFIKLLAIATALDVNILPLTWRPDLEVLGEGATGRVNQSHLNTEVSLAFKRFSRANTITNIPSCDMRSLQYKAITAEIVALSCPDVYDHPNIVNLEGVGWEVVEDSEEVWPVLVYRKAECGNLNDFLSLPEGAAMELDDLVSVCGEVAKGLRIMHLCGTLPQKSFNEPFQVLNYLNRDSPRRCQTREHSRLQEN